MLIIAGCPLNPKNKVSFINSLPLWVGVFSAFLNRQAVIRGLLAHSMFIKKTLVAGLKFEAKSIGASQGSDYSWSLSAVNKHTHKVVLSQMCVCVLVIATY